MKYLPKFNDGLYWLCHSRFWEQAFYNSPHFFLAIPQCLQFNHYKVIGLYNVVYSQHKCRTVKAKENTVRGGARFLELGSECHAEGAETGRVWGSRGFSPPQWGGVWGDFFNFLPWNGAFCVHSDTMWQFTRSVTIRLQPAKSSDIVYACQWVYSLTVLFRHTNDSFQYAYFFTTDITFRLLGLNSWQ